MTVWAIGDLHLSFSLPDKKMDVFGPQWKNHPENIRKNWLENIRDHDLVLIPGDISWAMHTEDAKKDLEWIHSLPGTKVMIRGNHDYWWSSLKKIEAILPPSIHLIQNNTYTWKNITIAGARLWDSDEYSFHDFVEYKENPKENALIKTTSLEESQKENQKIFARELTRLESSLKQFSKHSSIRIAMTHYPPIGNGLNSSKTSALLEKYGVSLTVFGHLHNIRKQSLSFGKKNGITYHLASCDYLNFSPLKLLDE